MFRIAVQAQWNNARDPVRSAKSFRALLVEDKRSLEEIAEHFCGEEGLGVRSLSIFEAHLLSIVNRSPEADPTFELAQQAAGYVRDDPTPIPGLFEKLKTTWEDAGNQPAIDRLGPNGFFEILRSWVPCAVDLRLDDETLMESFEIWLTLQRNVERMKHTSGPITEKTREKWHRLRLLPAFDMLLWAGIQGQHPTDAFMGRLLWPDDTAANANELVDTTERYRKLTKPAIPSVFVWQTVDQLIRQLEADRIFQNLLDLHSEATGTKNGRKRSGSAVKLKTTGREIIPAAPSTKKKR